MQLQFLALVEFFLAVERLQFLTRAELLFFYLMLFCARGLSRPHFVIRMGTFNHCGRSKAWNGTHHGRYVFQTVFLLRNMNTNMYTYTYINKYIFSCACTYACACTCVCHCIFLLCVPCHVVCRALVGWLVGWVGGVVLSTCRCRGGRCPWSFLLRMMSFLQRARVERSMIERRAGQCMECVVLVPFSK